MDLSKRHERICRLKLSSFDSDFVTLYHYKEEDNFLLVCEDEEDTTMLVFTREEINNFMKHINEV